VRYQLARYNKKRAKELKHDVFRDKTMEAVEKLGNALEGKDRSYYTDLEQRC